VQRNHHGSDYSYSNYILKIRSVIVHLTGTRHANNSRLFFMSRYSTGYLDLFRRLVPKHNLKFRELNPFRPSGETVERHSTQIHSLEKVRPCHFSSESISFIFGDTVAYFTRLTIILCFVSSCYRQHMYLARVA
jgi:hypothetical protein